MENYHLKLPINQIIQGHSLDVLKNFPDESIDMVITSPPYFGLRDYSMEGQIGLEKTLDEYLEKMLAVTAELKRVLKKTGTMWWNHGDSYASLGSIGGDFGQDGKISKGLSGRSRVVKGSYPEKSLLLQNFRLIQKMIDEQQFILRNMIVWEKPNAMPSSVSDRFTVDFEPVFFFCKSNEVQYWVNEKTGLTINKQPRGIHGIENEDWEWRDCSRCKNQKYIPDSSKKQDMAGNPTYVGFNQRWKEKYTKIPLEESEKMGSPRGRNYRICTSKRCVNSKVKYSLWSSRDYWFEPQYEPYTESMNRWGGDKLKANGESKWDKGTGQDTYRDRNMRPNELGRNKRCVWKIPTKPFSGAHFAVFPSTLLITPIKSSCPEFICKKCQLPREKIFTKGDFIHTGGSRKKDTPGISDIAKEEGTGYHQPNFIGYTNCGCDHEDGWNKGIILDPFMGSGTTALTAKQLGRDYIGIEINPQYIAIANKRLSQKTLF